jgi:hypothetical protein
MVEIGSLCSKLAYSAELKKHMYLFKENCLWQKHEHVAYWLPVRIEVVCEKNTSCNLGFFGGDSHFCSKRAYSAEWKTLVSLERKPPMLEAAALEDSKMVARGRKQKADLL